MTTAAASPAATHPLEWLAIALTQAWDRQNRASQSSISGHLKPFFVLHGRNGRAPEFKPFPRSLWRRASQGNGRAGRDRARLRRGCDDDLDGRPVVSSAAERNLRSVAHPLCTRQSGSADEFGHCHGWNTASDALRFGHGGAACLRPRCARGGTFLAGWLEAWTRPATAERSRPKARRSRCLARASTSSIQRELAIVGANSGAWRSTDFASSRWERSPRRKTFPSPTGF